MDFMGKCFGLVFILLGKRLQNIGFKNTVGSFY